MDSYKGGDFPGDLPDTYTIETPRGGRHYYFEGSLPSTVSKLAKGVDTRGVGGYVLAPPSRTVDGEYRVLNNGPLAPLPSWIGDALKPKAIAQPASDVTADDPINIARAIAHLNALPVATEKNGCDARTFEAACFMRDFGLSQQATFDTMREHYRCEPHDERFDNFIARKILSAYRNAQNGGGTLAVAPAAEVFSSHVLDTLAAETPMQGPRSRFHLEDEGEQDAGEDPQWLVPDLIQDNTTVLLVGPPSSYKSFLALDVALSLATGTDTFGQNVARRGPTIYAAAEGRANIKRARRRAWKLGRQLDKPISDFYVCPAPMIADPEQVQEFGNQIGARLQGQRPALIVLDTVSKMMIGLNENDAGDVAKFSKFCDSLVEAFRCPVMALHHTGKDESRGSRGSSGFLANFDTVLTIKSWREARAVEVHVQKHKDAEERERPWTFEGRVVGPSLVFYPTDAATHRALTEVDDVTSGKRIGAALKVLNAAGRENAVTTIVLATELGGHEGNDAERTAIARALRKAARGQKLDGYCDQAAGDWIWFMPA